MEVFEAKVYQCGKCWGMFEAVLNQKTKPWTVIYTHPKEECADAGVAFKQRMQLETVMSEKEEGESDQAQASFALEPSF